MTFKKEVAGCEKYFIAYNQLRPPFVIQLALEGFGDPSGDDLFDALERTTAANPGSSLRFEKDGAEESWVIGPPPTLTVVDAPNWTGDSGDEAPFLMWPLDPFVGPSCELLLVRGKTKTYLVFRALHAVMDGQGTIAWVKDFMRCLRGETPIGHSSTLTVEELLKEIKTTARPLPLADSLNPYGVAKGQTAGDFYWKRVSVDKPLDSAVAGRILVALAEQARSLQSGRVRINLPTDLRHYRPDERTTGNLYNSLFLEVPEGASAQMISLKIVQMLYKHEGKKSLGTYIDNNLKGGSLAVHRVKVLYDLAHMHDSGRYAFSATVSHLGVLQSADFSAPSFDAKSAMFVPLVGDAGCVVSLSGFDDHTVVAAGLVDRFASGGRLESMAEMLRAAVQG